MAGHHKLFGALIPLHLRKGRIWLLSTQGYAKPARDSIGAWSEFAIQLIVPSWHTCDRKKRFAVHCPRKVGIRLQLQLYGATACDAQWFSRCGLLLGPSPEHRRNHGWWRRVSCSAHFVTPWAQLAIIPTWRPYVPSTAGSCLTMIHVLFGEFVRTYTEPVCVQWLCRRPGHRGGGRFGNPLSRRISGRRCACSIATRIL
jgi:hypothetical protein